MLRLIARYADSWNTAWHHEPSSAVARIESIRAACVAEGRDPATLQITAAVAIAYPDLGPSTLPTPLTGSAEDIARSVDSIGGNLDAFTSKELVCYNTKVLDEHLPRAFDVLADLILHPMFRLRSDADCSMHQ